MTKLRDLVSHPFQIAWIVILSKLFTRELPSLRVGFKPGEEKGECCEVEELVLSAAAVFVHGFANNREVDETVLKVLVVFVVPVGKYKEFDELYELELCLA